MSSRACRPGALACGVLAAAAICLGDVKASSAFTADCPFGVNSHQASNAALDLVAAAGIGWVRFDLNWFQFEPQPGQYAWTEADRFIDHAHALGLHVFVTIAYSPEWAVAGPCNNNDPNPVNICRNRPPTSVSYWTDFVTAVVNRYKDRVTHFGMWNEPNLLGFFNGTRDQYVSLLLIPGSDAVHAACSSCFVLGPELAHLRGANWDADEGICVAGQCAFNGWNHSLSQILQAAGGYLDIITHHKYADPAVQFWQQAVDGEWVGPVQIINGIKEVTDQWAPGKEVWITEFGMESEPYGDHSNAETAVELTGFYQGFRQIQNGTFPSAGNQPWPQLKKLFWYDLHDDPSGYSWGLLEADLTPKPQYDAYADVIQALGSCDGTGGQGGGSSSGTGGSSSSGTGGTSSSSGTGGAGGAGGDTTSSSTSSGAPSSGSPATAAPDDEGSCGCYLPRQPRGQLGWLALALSLGSLAAARRRACAS